MQHYFFGNELQSKDEKVDDSPLPNEELNAEGEGNADEPIAEGADAEKEVKEENVADEPAVIAEASPEDGDKDAQEDDN